MRLKSGLKFFHSHGKRANALYQLLGGTAMGGIYFFKWGQIRLDGFFPHHHYLFVFVFSSIIFYRKMLFGLQKHLIIIKRN